MIAMPNTEYPPTVVEWMKSKGITPEAASAAGVEPMGSDGVRYPNGRTRCIDGHTKQPKGEGLRPWPIGGEIAPRAIVFVAEGESDGLAILSATMTAGPRAATMLAGVHVLAVPGAACPPGRAVEALPEGATAILCFDADDPGRTAATKHVDALRDAGVAVYDFNGLPEGCKDMAEHLAPMPPGERADWLADIVVDAQTAIDAAQEAAAEVKQRTAKDSKDSAPSPRKPPVIPRPLSDLLDAVEVSIRRYVVLPNDHTAKVLALWVAHTYAIDGAHTTPYLSILSPEKQSGKSRLLEVLQALSYSAWPVAGAPSEAALFRKVGSGVTLLLDETDALWAGTSERTEPIRAILNSGNRRGATVPRCVGEKMEVRDFPVFGAKVLAGIDNGRHPDTIRDRSIEIKMRRKKSDEQVKRFRYRTAVNDAAQIRDELEAWADDETCAVLEAAEVVELDELSDRLNEAAEPLIAIADEAGGKWPDAIRTAIVELAGEAVEDTATNGTLALRKLWEVFGDRPAVSSAELCEALNADDQLPFGGWRAGEGLNSRGLAKLLRPYKVKSKSIRIGDETPKGYARDDLLDAWARYTPDLLDDPLQDVKRNTEPPLPERDVADVADVADFQGYREEDGLQAEAERLLEDHADLAGGDLDEAA